MDTNKISRKDAKPQRKEGATADRIATPWSAASLARPKGVATQRFDVSHDIERA
jgi:hypothetical protein